jgi:zinc D-Ala-D-Ala carboxypeptidase
MTRRALLAAVLSLGLLTAGQARPGSAVPAAAADYCAVRDVLTPYSSGDGYVYALLDRTYMLPPSFVPADLVSVSAAGFSGYRTGELVRRIIVADLAALRSAAAQAGHHLQAQSGYRSYATQQATFDYWVSTSGYEQALRFSARAGHSEHQLGTTIDLTSGGTAPWNYADWAATAAGAWTAANAWRFGFVMSYPRGSEAVTCYGYEPWHYRWVGRDLATILQRDGYLDHPTLIVDDYLRAAEELLAYEGIP